MAEDPRIIRPSVPFIDERTGTIALSWYNWLLSLVQKVNTTEITNVFNSTTSVTQELSATSASAQASRVVAETPVLTPQVTKREIQELRVVDLIPKQDSALSNRVDALTIQLAQLNAAAANLANKVQELQVQLAMRTQVFPSWTFGQADTVSPTSPNRTLKVGVGGTSYYIHAKTTND